MRTFSKIIAYVLLSVSIEYVSSYVDFSQSSDESIEKVAMLEQAFQSDSLDHHLETGITLKYKAEMEEL